MKSIPLTITAVLMLKVGIAHADAFDDAIAANKRGDYFTSFPLFEKLASQGDAAAQTSLGLMLEKGQGVAPRKRRAEGVDGFVRRNGRARGRPRFCAGESVCRDADMV